MEAMELLTEPDGITGAAAAIQGIRDMRLLLHGQNGCRKGLLPLERCIPSDGPAIPYTDVSPADYYGGTVIKLERSLDALSGEGLVAVLETPALTLIGDDVEGMAKSRKGCIRLDTDSLGNDIGTGFDSTIVSVLDHLTPERSGIIDNGVNILGLSVTHKDWRTVQMEMGHLLKNAGLRLVSVVGADCTLGDLRDSVRSRFNIVVDPEFCSRTVGFYEAMGVETVGIGCQPIGFDRVEDLYRAVSEATGRRTSHAFEMLAKYRRRAYDGIKAYSKSLVGKTYAIDASVSVSDPLSCWLETSFDMVADEFGRPDYLFTSGPKAFLEQASGGCGKGVAVRYPHRKYDFVKSPIMGLDGAMYLLDALLNRSRLECFLWNSNSWILWYKSGSLPAAFWAGSAGPCRPAGRFGPRTGPGSRA
ncbi:MAG: hypothetical protein E7Z68_09785, partial [Thermoplasmata archaeon]|nr:hypothetical protein [Thermoplasmata archaeon]